MATSALLEAFIIAISTAAQPTNFFLIVVGMLLGFLMGMLPGLGGTVTLALLIPLTYGMDPLVAFMLFAAALGGTNFGGSVTAILINTPGSAPNAATLLDGYPMTRNGEAGRAIGASAAASALGAFFGIFLLLISIPFLRPIIVQFGPPEIVLLGIWGLTVISTIVSGALITGLISAAMGLIFVMHGLNHVTAGIRWTYGQTFLLDGFKLIPALIGLFAIAEMMFLVSKGGSIAEDPDSVEVAGGQWQGVRDVFTHKYLFIRSAFIGAVIGVIPGVGGTAANYIAYFQAVQTSKNSESFGTGDVRGVIASEASNDAKDGTGFLPTLGLGIPGSASMAVLLGAFILHGITPGPLLMENNLDIVAIIIVALFISNILTSSIGLIASNKLIYVTRVDIRIIAPLVIVVSFLGTFALNNNINDLYITLLFGLLGFTMMKVNMSRIPLILALVLGPIIEQNFFRSLQISRGEYGIFFESHISWILLFLIVLSLFQPIIKQAISR